MKNIEKIITDEKIDNSIFNFIPTARHFVGGNYISWVAGEVKIYTDNETTITDLIKVINSKRVMYKDKDFYIIDVVIKDKKKFKTYIQGIDTKYEYDCLFFGSGIKGDFLLNVSNMIVLSTEDTSIDFERLLKTNFVMKFDYVEASVPDELIRVGRNIYLTHPWGKSLGSTALECLSKHDNYQKQLDILDFTLENLVINDFYDKLINFNKAQKDDNKFSKEELSKVFVGSLFISFYNDGDIGYCNEGKPTLLSLRKYKSVIENLFEMSLKEMLNMEDFLESQYAFELLSDLIEDASK